MSGVVRALEVRFAHFLEPHGYMSVVNDVDLRDEQVVLRNDDLSVARKKVEKMLATNGFGDPHLVP